MKSVNNKVWDQAWFQVRDPVSNQIWNQVWNLVPDTVRLQVTDRIRGHIRRQVRSPRVSHETRQDSSLASIHE